MGNNDCFVAMRCFWELSFIPGWIHVAFWSCSVFLITQTPLQDVPTSEQDLHYAPLQQSDQCMQISAQAVSGSLQRSQAKDPAAGLGPQL